MRVHIEQKFPTITAVLDSRDRILHPNIPPEWVVELWTFEGGGYEDRRGEEFCVELSLDEVERLIQGLHADIETAKTRG